MNYLVRTPEQLGQVLQGQRKATGLTQKQAAEQVGLWPKTISALEHHPRGSSLDSLFKLLAALDLELVVRSKEAASKSSAAAPGPSW